MNTRWLATRRILRGRQRPRPRREAASANRARRPGTAMLAAALLAAASARADYILDADFGVNYDSNLNHAGYVAHADGDLAGEEDGAAVAARVAPGQYLQLTDRTALVLQADLAGEVYPKFDGLNHFIAGGTAALRTKLGLGAEAPWFRVGVSAARDEFSSRTRDAWAFGATVSAGRQFGDRLALQAQYEYEGRSADEARVIRRSHLPGDAYDTDAHSLGLAGTYAITNALSLQLSYTHRYGDVVAVNRRDYEIYEYADAVTPEDTFGDYQIAYRSVMHTNIVGIGLSHALGKHTSLNLGYRYEDSDNDYFEYDNHGARLAILYSF